MSVLPMLVNHNSGFDAALLSLAHSRHTIYEHTRMSGENRSAHQVLPVDRCEKFSDELEMAYACNMAKHFGEAHDRTRMQSIPVSRQERLLNEALLLMAHSQRSIYDNSRISGENRIAHLMLPTDRLAEQSDHCSDATDVLYTNAMANYFATKSASQL